MNEETISDMQKLIINAFIKNKCLPIQNLYLHPDFSNISNIEALEEALQRLSDEGILKVSIQTPRTPPIPLKVLHVSLTEKGKNKIRCH